MPGDYKHLFDPSKFEKHYSNGEENLKLLIFYDSFMDAMQDFLFENFNETTAIWNHILDEEIIEEEKPDTVILEMVERHLDNLLDNKIK